ncbi:MAG: hypothetical protein ACLQKH_17965 [Steroidobacteraceae bacterium]
MSRQRTPGDATTYEQRRADLRRLEHGEAERIRFPFPDGTVEEISIAEWRGMQDDLRKRTIERLQNAYVAAEQKRQRPEQMRQAGKVSGETRRAKNAKRNRKIHDMHASGETQISIAVALKPNLSQAQVSRILKKPRP